MPDATSSGIRKPHEFRRMCYITSSISSHEISNHRYLSTCRHTCYTICTAYAGDKPERIINAAGDISIGNGTIIELRNLACSANAPNALRIYKPERTIMPTGDITRLTIAWERIGGNKGGAGENFD